MQPRSFAPNAPAKLLPADEPPPMLKVRPEIKSQSGTDARDGFPGPKKKKIPLFVKLHVSRATKFNRRST